MDRELSQSYNVVLRSESIIFSSTFTSLFLKCRNKCRNNCHKKCRKKKRKGDEFVLNEKEVICGLYPRVSTEDQVREGFSLDEQEESLRKLCEYKGYKIYKVYREEGVSAKNMKRPKFQEMIQDMKDG